MKRLLIGGLATAVVMLMVLSVIPVTVSEDSGTSRGTQQIIYEEHFSTGAGGWSGRIWSWSGSYMRSGTSGSRVEYCYSPTIDLSKGKTNAELSVRVWSRYPFTMYTYVEISKNNGATYKNIYQVGYSGWRTLTFDNTVITDDYLVSGFKMRIGGGHPSYGWGGWQWYIDDVVIKAEAGIAATVDVDPDTLNLDSNGNWVTVRIMDFPEDPSYDPTQVIDGTVTLEDIGADPNGPSGIEDGYYMCKVDRMLLEDSIGAPGDVIELTVNGDVADTSFEGTNSIRAIHGI